MNYKIIILLLTISIFFTYCQTPNKNKIENKTVRNIDTLQVDYTYWWSNSGPFIGLCGDEYSFAFLGIVKEIDKPIKQTQALAISQRGSIEIVKVLKTRKLIKEEYKNQKYFSSSCFYNSNLKKGDKVMVFCYEYEGSYSIPNKKSIIKINEFDDQIVKSIQKYISANQNPTAIKKDLNLWSKRGFGDDLKQLIECREEMDKYKQD
jgi:hypothetical protein